MTRHLIPATATFIGAAGNKLVADVFGDSGSPVLLLHGGGQTRHAWHKTAQEIARKGHTAYALDQRGHGDSDWVATTISRGREVLNCGRRRSQREPRKMTYTPLKLLPPKWRVRV
jgi:pimeloyl-ACP methyl ester carboxylesterase